ncbi:MAG: hypothetical protein JNM39_07540 [Bdellovibrionaceae bacterium]|nr:hypothetical protein [Pseudobdellovibrionaceae bacterium]
MTEFMLIMKGEYQSWNAMSADEKQRIMEKYYAFVNRLKREERFKGGSALKNGGINLRSEKGIVITDGPFPETKETFNGYFVFTAKDRDEAVAIARECPALTHGETVEIFEMGEH